MFVYNLAGLLQQKHNYNSAHEICSGTAFKYEITMILL